MSEDVKLVVAIEDPAEQEKNATYTELYRLEEFLVSGPLYSTFKFSEYGKNLSRFPPTIRLHCTDPNCRKEQTFERGDANSGGTDRGWGKVVSFKCRNCNNRVQKYMYIWQGDDPYFMKVGQLPELKDAIDPQLSRAIGKSKSLYLKAIRSRSFGFGIGAVSYLRRIIEDETDALMDLLKDDKWETWNKAERKQFERARTTYQYSRKIEYAAESILPPSVFANGRDSFTALHDVTSNGLHGKTEEECIAIFDKCNLIFTRTFRKLFEDKRERDEFTAQLTDLKR